MNKHTHKMGAALAAIFSVIGLTTAGGAEAAVLRCDACTAAGVTNAARAAGAGTHVIADYVNKSVVAKEVEYDRELRVWRVLPVTIPEKIRASFTYDVTYVMASSSGAQIVVGPGRSGPFSFPAAYNDANAYDIVGSASLRSNLEQQIARLYAGASTGNTSWDGLAISLKSLTLSVLGQYFGTGAVTITIVWKDGSKTVLKVEAGNADEAKYQSGQSRDASGNKIPDAAATNPATGGGYAGQYHFRNSYELQEWLNAAAMY